jgi:hypothetical protein
VQISKPLTLLFPTFVSIVFTITGCGGQGNMASANAPVPAPTAAPTATPAPAGATDPSPSPSPTPLSPAVPSNAKTITKIESLPGWQFCTAQTANHRPCASGLGNATSSKIDDQLSPSLDRSSSKFEIGGPIRYSNALWWKSFPTDSRATHFTYDLWFYIDHPDFSEALEFDVNQSFHGIRFAWATECSFKDSKHWDVWDPKDFKWVPSKLPCPEFSAFTWHHIIWEFEKSNGRLHYKTLTVDDHAMAVDMFMDPQTNWSGEDINVAFQMDGNFRQAPYSVWLDKVTLSFW